MTQQPNCDHKGEKNIRISVHLVGRQGITALFLQLRLIPKPKEREIRKGSLLCRARIATLTCSLDQNGNFDLALGGR